jgi:HEAT repeat protein
MATIFNRPLNLNPYPVKWRLPGHKTNVGTRLEQVAQRTIVHALTYHEIPPNIDAKIDALPSEESLQALNPLQKDYLSFTVYSLKQMVATGTIAAETAWTLFNAEWGKIRTVKESSFSNMRKAFFNRTLMELTKEFGESQVRNNGQGLFINSAGEIDLLAFEFYARAGEEGLAQYEKFSEWSQNLSVYSSTENEMSTAVKSEYRKALWTEMRIIEGQVGINCNINSKVQSFVWQLNNGAYSEGRIIKGSINAFAGREGRAIDAIIKAEIGHAMDHAFNGSEKCFHTLLTERTDRTNVAAYTPRVIEAFRDDAKQEIFPPEIRAFVSGGFYVSSRGNSFPSYPQGYPKKSMDAADVHYIAELFDWHIRQSIISDANILANKKYHEYRWAGLGRDARSHIKLYERAWESDCPTLRFKAVHELSMFGDKTAVSLLELALMEGDNYLTRGLAAEGLIRIKGLTPKDGDRFARLDTHRLDNQKEWVELKQLWEISTLPEIEIARNEAALQSDIFHLRLKATKALSKVGEKTDVPLLERALEDVNHDVRAHAAEGLIRIKDLTPKDGDRFTRLDVHRLIRKGEWDKVKQLGEIALPAIKIAAKDGNPLVKIPAVRTLEELGVSIRSLVGLERDLNEGNLLEKLEALSVIREKGGEEVLKILKRAIENASPGLRKPISNAIEHVSKELSAAEASFSVSEFEMPPHNQLAQFQGMGGGLMNRARGFAEKQRYAEAQQDYEQALNALANAYQAAEEAGDKMAAVEIFNMQTLTLINLNTVILFQNGWIRSYRHFSESVPIDPSNRAALRDNALVDKIVHEWYRFVESEGRALRLPSAIRQEIRVSLDDVRASRS